MLYAFEKVRNASLYEKKVGNALVEVAIIFKKAF